MRNWHILWALLCPMMVWCKGLEFDARLGLGQDSTDVRGVFCTHAVVEEFPLEGEARFTVSVNGAYIGLYNDRSKWDGLVHFGSFEFEDGEEIILDIQYSKKIENFELLPGRQLRLKKVRRTSDHSIRVWMNCADQNLTLVVNDEPQKDVLHLFCNSMDHNRPQGMDKGMVSDKEHRLLYFGPGYHSLAQETGNDVLSIENGWRVYLDAGAVVHGSFYCQGLNGMTIDGRGMVYNDHKRVILDMEHCEGSSVQGVLFHAHRASMWQVIMGKCRNMEMQGVKILSTRYASTDGLDVVNSQFCTFRDCFIRACDDAISLKGLENKPIPECMAVSNLTFSGMQLWNDCNSGFVIGEESHASVYENIRFENSSILYSYDDPDHHEELPERAALTICCLHATWFRNISYEDVDVYHCERFIAEGFLPNFWFGSIPGDQTGPGGIKKVVFRNVHCYGNSGSRIANKIHLYGWKTGNGTPDKWVEDIVFQNVTVEGKKLRSTHAPCFSETDWERVRNVSTTKRRKKRSR